MFYDYPTSFYRIITRSNYYNFRNFDIDELERKKIKFL